MSAIVATTTARSIARSIIDGDGHNNDTVDEVVPVPGTMSSPAVRAHNPVYLNS